MSYLKDRVNDPNFFVFSDDHPWVRDNIRLGYPTTFVTHNGPERNYEDLRLMSLCKHNIIANSSFGWWGAWLNTKPEKVGLAPNQWFNDARLNTSDLIPAGWIRL